MCTHSFEWYDAPMRRPDHLPPVQRRVLCFFERRARHGLPPPTLRELCEEFGWSSTGTARDHIRALVRKGLLEAAQGRARGASLARLPVASVSLPILGDVAAGLPVQVEQVVADSLPVPEGMVRRADSFLLRVRGDSMEGAGILDGDLVVVAPDPEPPPGSIVAVTLDGETTLKRLERTDDGWMLVAENPHYGPIPIETPGACVHGVVTGVLRVLDGGHRGGLQWQSPHAAAVPLEKRRTA